MGGKTALTALNVVMFPSRHLDMGMLRDILRGGYDNVVEVGVCLVGGHTVDEKGKKTDLVTTGIFEKIRNPTYSGLFLVCLGSFVIIPSTAVMVWGIVFYIAIEFQVRIEEEHLTDAHGERYVLYCKKSKRYIPYLY